MFGSEEGYGWLILLISTVVVGLVFVVGILVRRGRVRETGSKGAREQGSPVAFTMEELDALLVGDDKE